jgi:hypothetical protein
MTKVKQCITLLLHVVVLAMSVGLVAVISYDMLRNMSFLDDARYVRMQLLACLLYQVDIVVSFMFAPRKWRYVVTHITFFLVCVPYLSIFELFDVELTRGLHYFLHVIPFVRVAYVFAIVAGAFRYNNVTGIFTAYMTLLMIVVYLSGLIFFVEEHTVNAEVNSYWTALYWAILSLDTVGCSIPEYTVIGKVLSVVLSAGGLILFPVFTVFIANALTGNKKDDAESAKLS